jgi:Cellulose biosynthesis protein BcsS
MGVRHCIRVAGAATVFFYYVICIDVSISPARAGDDEDATVILFSGRDIWRNGAFMDGGLLIAPGGFDQDGLMLKLLYSNGLYRYNSNYLRGEQVVGWELMGAAMPGWRIKRNGIEAKFFFGIEYEWHRLWPNDPSNKLRGSAIGARVAAEFWYEPTPTTMMTGDISLATVATNNSARFAYGWRVLDDLVGGFYIGPEIQFYASDGYRHLRFGSHLTGLKTGNYEWSAAAGWARDSDARSSPYVRLNFMTRQ